jgi:uncharacterized protein (TIGR02001 family)
MNKKITAFVLAALTVGAFSVNAQTPAPTPAPAAAPAPAPAAPGASWTLTPAVASQYMFRGARLGGPSFEPTVEYDNGALALGVWSNFPIKDKVPGQSDPEIDPYGSYKIDVAKDMTLQPGFTLYTYANAKKSDGFYKATFEPSLAFNYTIDALTLTPKVYYDVVLSQLTLEFNAAYSIPLKDLGTEIDFAGTIGTFEATDAVENASPSYKNWGNYWLAGITLPFQVTKDTKLSIGWAYTKGSQNFLKQGTFPKFENTAAVGRGVVTVSYAISF